MIVYWSISTVGVGGLVGGSGPNVYTASVDHSAVQYATSLSLTLRVFAIGLTWNFTIFAFSGGV